MHKPRMSFGLVVTLGVSAVLGVDTGLTARSSSVSGHTEIEYRVRSLPGLGGTSSRSNGINDWGLVTGFSNLSGDAARRAVVWFAGRGFDLGTLGGTNSSVAWSGLPNRGLIVGIAQTSAPQARTDGWSCRAFFPGADRAKFVCVGAVWEWGQIRALPTPAGRNSFATSGNDRRQVVGWMETPEPDPTCVNPVDRGFRAVLWDLSRGNAVDLPPLGHDTASAATAVSQNGRVVGISGDCDQSVGRHSARHAVRWDRGRVESLGTFASTTWNTPTAVTAAGDIIVGFANGAGASPDAPMFRAWLWSRRDDLGCTKQPGTHLCDLGTLDEGGTAEAWGVNERGQVVGTACAPSGVCRAFLWERGSMRDLNDAKGDYPHHLFNAMSINERGQITGRAQTVSPSGFEAFVATPAERGR